MWLHLPRARAYLIVWSEPESGQMSLQLDRCDVCLSHEHNQISAHRVQITKDRQTNATTPAAIMARVGWRKGN